MRRLIDRSSVCYTLDFDGNQFVMYQVCDVTQMNTRQSEQVFCTVKYLFQHIIINQVSDLRYQTEFASDQHPNNSESSNS